MEEGESIASSSLGESDHTSAKNGAPSAVTNIYTAVQCKEKGNKSFAEGDLDSAMKYWHEGLLHVAGINSLASMYGAKSTPLQNQKAQELTVAFRSNLAACYIKQERWEKAIYMTTKVLDTDPSNLKARYRRSLAYLRMKNSQKAAADLDIALELAPKDVTIRRLAAELVEQEEDRIDKAREEEAAKVEAEEDRQRQIREAERYNTSQ